MPERGTTYFPAENLGIDDAGYAPAHRLANFIYYVVTGVDVELMRMALVLRNSMDDADSVAAEMTGDDVLTMATKAALSIRPRPDDDPVIFHESEADKWYRSIACAATDEGWPQFDLHSLAPIQGHYDGPVAVGLAKVLDWLKRTAHPTLAVAVERELVEHCEYLQLKASQDSGTTEKVTSPDGTTCVKKANGEPQAERRQRGFTRAVFDALDKAELKPGQLMRDAVNDYFSAGRDTTGVILRTEPGYKFWWKGNKEEELKADRAGLDRAIAAWRDKRKR